MRTALVLAVCAFAAPLAAQAAQVMSVGSNDFFQGDITFDITAFNQDVEICGFELYVGLEKGGGGSAEYVAQVDSAPSLGAGQSHSIGWNSNFVGGLDVASRFTSTQVKLATPITIFAGTTRGIYFCAAHLTIPGDAVALSQASGPRSNVFATGPDFVVSNGEGQRAFYGTIYYVTGNAICPQQLALPVNFVPTPVKDGPGGEPAFKTGCVNVLQRGPSGQAFVNFGDTATAEAGAILKLGDTPGTSKQLVVNGTLDTSEGFGVTSLWDAAAGGDTATLLTVTPRAPARGDSDGLLFNDGSDASSWLGGFLRFAGGAGRAAAQLARCDAGFEFVAFSENGVGTGFTLDCGNSSHPTVRGCFFGDNDGGTIGKVPFESLPKLEFNTATNNAAGDAITIRAAATINDIFVEQRNIIGDTVVMDGNLEVRAPGRATVGEGIHFLFDPGTRGGFKCLPGATLNLLGTGAFPISLASRAANPMPGDILGLDHQGTGKVEHVEVSHAGGSPSTLPGVALSSDKVTVESLTVRDCSGDAVFVRRAAGDLANLFVHRARGYGIHVNGATGQSFDITHATVTDGALMGIEVNANSNWIGRIVNSICWNNAGGNYGPRVVAGRVLSSNGGFAGQNGNINQDPMVQPDGSLAPSSPSIDAGSNALQPALDLVDSGRGVGGGTDQGVREYNPTTIRVPVRGRLGVLYTVEVPAQNPSSAVNLVMISATPGLQPLPGLGTLAFPLSTAFMFTTVGTTPLKLQLPQLSGANFNGLPWITQAAVAANNQITLSNAVVSTLEHPQF